MKMAVMGALLLGGGIGWTLSPVYTEGRSSASVVATTTGADRDFAELAADKPGPILGPTGMVIEDAKQVYVRVDGGVDRELQWVRVRNRSDRVINLSTADVRTEFSYSLAPKGMQLISGSFELDPREAALIVTSPYVELDRGVAVEWANVYLAYDQSLNAQVHSLDIQTVELVTMMGEVMGDFGPVALAPSCCCEGSGGVGNCDATLTENVSEQNCLQNDCAGGDPCGCWRLGPCPEVIPTPSCCPGGNCVLDL